MGTMLAAVAVFFFQDRDLHDLVEKKKQEERRTYPEILQKLTLYLEAGLTVRAAFCRVAEDYEKERAQGGQRLQNLKKGSTTLLQQLKEEVREAEEVRMQNARKLSEEATTKLLLPMVLLLVIVMVMIMVPAFSNAGI